MSKSEQNRPKNRASIDDSLLRLFERDERRGEKRRGEYFAFNYACLICLYPSTSGGYSSTHPSPCGTNPKLIQSLGNFQNFSANYFIYFREYELYDRMMNEIEIKEGGKNSINPIFEDWREFHIGESFYIFSKHARIKLYDRVSLNI